MLVHPLLRRFVVMSGGHCTYPTGGPAIRLKNKKTDEAQKAETVLSAVRYSSLAKQSFALRPNRALYWDESLPIAIAHAH